MADKRPILLDDEPIHRWFGLTYASYLVLHRSALQSMPLEWQERFVACLRELEDTIDYEAAGQRLGEADNFEVRLRGSNGRFVEDLLRDYDRGRRLLPLKGA